MFALLLLLLLTTVVISKLLEMIEKSAYILACLIATAIHSDINPRLLAWVVI